MPNLIPIPSNAFSGAAVKWDNAPVDRMLLQNTWAKQQASQLALDKYFDKQANQLTGTGMDMQNDGQDFIALKDKWQQHALQNRRAIVNPSLDGGKAAMESNALYNEARQFAQKSIQKVKNSQAAYKLLSDPAKAALLTDAARDQLHHGTLGLNDPEYVPIDLNSVAFNPKPWGTQDEVALSNEVSKYKGTAKDRPPVQDAKSGTQTVTTETTFSPDDLTGMYGTGHSRYYANPGFKKMIDEIPKNDPILFNNLNSLFKQHYGRDIQTGEDLAAAYSTSKNPNARSVDKTSPIPSYSDIAQGKKMQIASQNSANTLGRELTVEDIKNKKKEEKAAKATPDTEAMLSDIEKGAVKKQIQPFVNRGTPDAGYSVPITPEMKSAFKKVVGGHVEEPDDIKYKPNTNEYTAIWFKKDPETKATVKTAGGSSINAESLPPVTLPRATIKDEYDKTHLTKGTVAPGAKPAATPTGTRPPLDHFIKKHGSK